MDNSQQAVTTAQ